MELGTPYSSLTLDDIHKIIPEKDIAAYYLRIPKIPCRIHSPLRIDNYPSVGIYSPNGTEVNFIDFADGNRGRYYKLLSQMWNLSMKDTINKIVQELVYKKENAVSIDCTPSMTLGNTVHIDTGNKIEMACKTRPWEKYDLDYWGSYGISLEWLKWCEVYPISHKIFIKDENEYVFKADKYAYVFIERKEGKITMKFYQPFNKNGFKWQNNNDGSVLGLWTKIPASGDKVCICSSVKDAICLMSNLKIPCICVQGEGYSISETAVNELNRRFKHVYILLDNDPPGIENGERLAKETGFTNIVIPQFEGGKDVSDYMKVYGKEKFVKLFNDLITSAIFDTDDELPF